jgi:hypothetical protein
MAADEWVFGAFGLLVLAVNAGAVYVAMMLSTALRPNRDHVFKLYKYFPYINMVVGAGLFLVIAS